MSGTHSPARRWRAGKKRRGRTGLDVGVHEPAVLLPLHAHAPGVLPVARVRLLHFVQRSKSEAVRRVRDVLAERPPDTLLAWDAALAPSAGPFGVNVDGVDARPPSAAVQYRSVQCTSACHERAIE